MKLSDILYENGTCFVVKAKHGYEVYENGITHATRRVIVGYEGAKGLNSAKQHADRLKSSTPKPEGDSND